MFTWTSRHQILTWSIAWGVTAVGLFTADVFSHPRHGPLWVGLVLGLVAWSIAGATTLHRSRIAGGIVVWGVAYLVAFWLASLWAGSIGSAGFVGELCGWAAGGALGALASGYLDPSQARSFRPIAFATAWGLCFLVAGYIALTVAIVAAQAAKDVLAFLGSQRAALTIGWALGAAFGGMLAASIGLAARRAIFGTPVAAERQVVR